MNPYIPTDEEAAELRVWIDLVRKTAADQPDANYLANQNAIESLCVRIIEITTAAGRCGDYVLLDDKVIDVNVYPVVTTQARVTFWENERPEGAVAYEEIFFCDDTEHPTLLDY